VIFGRKRRGRRPRTGGRPAGRGERRRQL